MFPNFFHTGDFMFKIRKTFVSLIAMCLLAPAAVRAADALPTGKELMEKYITATGGRDAYMKVKSRMAKGTFDMPAANIKGEMTTFQSEDGKFKVDTNLGAVGTSEVVYDGTVGWQKSMMGVALMDEAQLEEMKQSQSLNSELKYEELYKSLEVTGVEDVEGKPAYVVKATGKNDKVSTMYYDKETSLPVKMSMVSSTPQGEIPMTMFMTEFKEFDGIKMPTVIKNEMMGQNFTVTMTEIKQNAEIPAGTFDQPEDVKKLLAKKSAAPATQPAAK